MTTPTVRQKTVEQTRKLVESDEVLLVFQPLGTAGNSAIQKYLNARKVPQLFVASGATKWGDPKEFPWTMGFQPNYQSEGRIYAKYILEHHASGKIGVLYQNDDFGKDVLKGLKDGLGASATMIISEATYEMSDPTANSQIVKLKTSGANIFVNIASPKFAAQAIRKVAELGWKPVHFLSNVSGSIGSVLQPAGCRERQRNHQYRLLPRIRPTRRGRTIRSCWAWSRLHGRIHARSQQGRSGLHHMIWPRKHWSRFSNVAAMI